MTESEWRNLGVQQSPGWTHYLIHEPGKIFKVSNELSITVKNLLLFQRKIYSQLAVWGNNMQSLFLMWLNVIQAKLSSSELARGCHLFPFGELQGLFGGLQLKLYWSVALLADCSGSIVPFWRIVADSRSLSSLPAGWLVVSYVVFRYSVGILTGKYLH